MESFGFFGVATNDAQAMPLESTLLSRFWAEAMSTFMYLLNRMPTKANEGVRPYERFYDMKPERRHEHFYGMKPDVGHIHTLRCVVPVTPFKEMLRKPGPWLPDGIQGRRQLLSLESI